MEKRTGHLIIDGYEKGGIFGQDNITSILQAQSFLQTPAWILTR
jgi:hypothetical protein